MEFIANWVIHGWKIGFATVTLLSQSQILSKLRLIAIHAQIENLHILIRTICISVPPEDQDTVFGALQGLKVVNGAAKLDIYDLPFVEVDRVFFYGEKGALGFVVISTKDVNETIVLEYY